MKTNESNHENRRLFERLSIDGIFVYNENSFSINDISVGGMQLDQLIPNTNQNEIIKGRIGIHQSGFRIYSDVVCELTSDTETKKTRLKFIRISEEFTEFLRSLALRFSSSTDYTASWFGSDSYQITDDDDPQKDKRFLRRLLGIEAVIGVMILGLALIAVVKTSSEQNFWVSMRHEIISPASGEITWLHSDKTTVVGDEIANISVKTLSNQNINLPIHARVSGQTLNWNFNVGDQVKESDALGATTVTPVSDQGIQCIIGFQSPVLSLKPGDILGISTGAHKSMPAKVTYAISPTQAAALTGISPDSFRFDEYFLVQLDASVYATLTGRPSVDILTTWLNRFSLSR